MTKERDESSGEAAVGADQGGPGRLPIDPGMKRQWDAGLYVIKQGGAEVGALWVIDNMSVEYWALFTNPAFTSPAPGAAKTYQFARGPWNAMPVTTPNEFVAAVLAKWGNANPRWLRSTVEPFALSLGVEDGRKDGDDAGDVPDAVEPTEGEPTYHTLQWDAGVTLLVRDLDKAGAVVALVTTATANNVKREWWALSTGSGTNVNGSKFEAFKTPATGLPTNYKYENLGWAIVDKVKFDSVAALWLDPATVRYETAYVSAGISAISAEMFAILDGNA